MDDPSLDADQHRQALRGLVRINCWSGSLRIVWPPIRRLARDLPARCVRVLDIATGAGDVPIALWQRARRRGLQLQVDGCDRSPRAVDDARARAKRAGAEVGFFELDVLARDIPSDYDIILTSLFLHHLETEQAVSLLRHMAEAARCLVLVHDLVRSAPGLALAYVGTRLLSASEVVRTDGPRSVRAAYTLEEVRMVARRAGLHSATVRPRWPCRFLLTWTRP